MSDTVRDIIERNEYDDIPRKTFGEQIEEKRELVAAMDDSDPRKAELQNQLDQWKYDAGTGTYTMNMNPVNSSQQVEKIYHKIKFLFHKNYLLLRKLFQ